MTKDQFTLGYICACATLAHIHGERTMAKDVLKQGGFPVDPVQLLRLGADPFDVEQIFGSEIFGSKPSRAKK